MVDIPKSIDQSMKPGAEKMVLRKGGPGNIEIPDRAPKFLRDRTDKWVSALGRGVYEAKQHSPDTKLSMAQVMAVELTGKLDEQREGGQKGVLEPKDYAKALICIDEALSRSGGQATGIEDPKSPYYVAHGEQRTKLLAELRSLSEDLMVHLTQPWEGRKLGLGISSRVQKVRSGLKGEYIKGKRDEAKRKFSLNSRYRALREEIAQERYGQDFFSLGNDEQKDFVSREVHSRLLMARDGERVRGILREVSREKTGVHQLVDEAEKNGSSIEKYLAAKIKKGEVTKLGERLLRNDTEALKQIQTADGLLKYIGYDQADANLSRIISREDLVKALSSYTGKNEADVASDTNGVIKALIEEQNMVGVAVFVSHLYKEKLDRLAAQRGVGKERAGEIPVALQRDIGEVSKNTWQDLNADQVALMLLGGKIPTADGTATGIQNGLKSLKMPDALAVQISNDIFTQRNLIQWNATNKRWEVNNKDAWTDENVITNMAKRGYLTEDEVKSLIGANNPGLTTQEVDSYYDGHIAERLKLMNTSLPENTRKISLGKWDLKNLALLATLTPGLLASITPILNEAQEDELNKYLQ